MNRSLWLPVAFLLALVALPRIGAAQEHAPGQPPAGVRCPAGETCPKPDPQAMAARHEAMMAEHAVAAARIQELQDRMHAADGDAKVDAIAALLHEMLAQHRAMHAMMMGMHPMGMDHDGMKHEGMEPDDEDR